MRTVVDLLIERARRTPYWHLYHGDGSLYMGRYWLKPHSDRRDRWAARVHHIATPDVDRHMHDHPWDFLSIVLRGGYTELRPLGAERCFEGEEEASYAVTRRAGSIALRRATDRHRIISVLPDTWTLFITGPKRHWWGFHTPAGKVHWQDYVSSHNNAPISEVAA